MRHPLLPVVSAALCALLLAACATGPDVRVQQDADADFGDYRSYAFVDQPGTDRYEYTSFTTRYLKDAVGRELEARGYQPAGDADPDLLVNFYVTTRERSEVRDTPRVGVGFHTYRRGRYGVWQGYHYPDSRQVRTWTEGALHVDIVDARESQLVWEGVVRGRITERARSEPRASIDEAVSAIFERYPYQAPAL